MSVWESALGPAALRAHLEWIDRGGMGEGRLQLLGLDLRGALVGANLSGSRLEKCDLSDSHFHLAQLLGVEWVECRLEGALLDGCDLEEAVLRNCDLKSLSAPSSDFVAARLSGCRLTGALLQRTGWNNAYVETSDFQGANLQDSTLDGAQFHNCDFRGATLLSTRTTPLGTAEGTLFAGCDFRNADLTNLAAASARFEGCRFHAARAETVFASGAILLRPDLSP